MPPPVRSVNDATVALVKSFEGIPDGDPTTVKIDAYLDPVGIRTIGWGHAIADGSGKWLRGPENKAAARALYPGGITLEQAETLLKADLIDTARDVQSVVSRPLTDNQFGALVSFTFNLGLGNLRQSTLLRKLNAADFTGGINEFAKWNKGTVNGVKKELPGLTRRRAAEMALFETP